jgi:predicted enzyme related to lactoylglutathione lyase
LYLRGVAEPRLALVILAARDLAAMKAFYLAVLGWQQVVDVPVYAELQADDGMRLGLYADDHFALNVGVFPPRSGGLTRTEIYLHCDELDAAIERAAAAGARPLSPRGPRSWGDEAAYFSDPEGNVLVLARPLSGG